MLVKSIKKNKSKYEINIDDINYIFDEEIVVKYRLVTNKEIDDYTLNKAIKDNENINYYSKALTIRAKNDRISKRKNQPTEVLI